MSRRRRTSRTGRLWSAGPRSRRSGPGCCRPRPPSGAAAVRGSASPAATTPQKLAGHGCRGRGTRSGREHGQRQRQHEDAHLQPPGRFPRLPHGLARFRRGGRAGLAELSPEPSPGPSPWRRWRISTTASEIAARTTIAIRIGTSGEEPPPSTASAGFAGALYAAVAHCRSSGRRWRCLGYPAAGPLLPSAFPWAFQNSSLDCLPSSLIPRCCRPPPPTVFVGVAPPSEVFDFFAGGSAWLPPAVTHPLGRAAGRLRQRSLRTGESKTPERARGSKPMPAEQALTQGPTAAAAGSMEAHPDASGARLEQTAALLAPVALIVGLALAGGGFDVSDASHRRPGRVAGRGRPAGLRSGLGRDGSGGRSTGQCGLIGGLALLSAISSLWSGSVELSVIEADRVLGLSRLLPCRIPNRPNRRKAPTFR